MKKNKHKYRCEQCNLQFESLCSTKHTDVFLNIKLYTGLNCAKIEKLYYKHLKTNKDCLNKFYEMLENQNIDLLKNGYTFQLRFTGMRQSSFRPPKYEIDKLKEKYGIGI